MAFYQYSNNNGSSPPDSTEDIAPRGYDEASFHSLGPLGPLERQYFSVARHLEPDHNRILAVISEQRRSQSRGITMLDRLRELDDLVRRANMLRHDDMVARRNRHNLGIDLDRSEPTLGTNASNYRALGFGAPDSGGADYSGPGSGPACDHPLGGRGYGAGITTMTPLEHCRSHHEQHPPRPVFSRNDAGFQPHPGHQSSLNQRQFNQRFVPDLHQHQDHDVNYLFERSNSIRRWHSYSPVASPHQLDDYTERRTRSST